MVYAYALDHLGFEQAHFDVRAANEKVWKFHERFGAKRVEESKINYVYEITNNAIRVSLSRYKKNICLTESHSARAKTFRLGFLF